MLVCDAVLARFAVFAAPSAYGGRCQSIVHEHKRTEGVHVRGIDG